MKRYISDRGSFRLRYVFAVLMMFLIDLPLFAQLHSETLVIAFSSSFSYTLDENVSWELKDENGSLILSRKGEVKDHIFSQPGNYTLHIHENPDHDTNACEHAHYPEKVNIQVTPVKVDFDFSTIQFSNEVVGGQSAGGTTIRIDVNFSSYDNGSAVYNLGFDSFGVGSTITGKLKNNEALLKPGVNSLEFILEGQAETGNNIQLNFMDYTGEVQPYTLTPKMR